MHRARRRRPLPPAASAALAILLLAGWPGPALAQLQGGSTYPINGVEAPPASFASIGSAASYLAAHGVAGSGLVALELADGYAGDASPITIGAIPGANADLEVVFRPAAGSTSLTSIPGTGGGPWAIRITGSFVTLDGRAGGNGDGRDWTIRCTGSGLSGYGQSAVRVDDTSQNVTAVAVRHCILEAEASNASSGILAVSGGTARTMTDVVFERNLVRSTGSAFPSCRAYAVSIAGASNAGNTGLVVRHNLIERFAFRGINVTGGFPGVEICGNEIFHSSPVTQYSPAEFSAIHFATASSPGATIRDNFVHDIRLTNGASAVNGIYLFNGNTSGEASRVFNNRVAIGPGVQTFSVPIYGIRDNSIANARFEVDGNSVWIGGSPAGGSVHSAAFRREVDSALRLRGNILCNARSNDGASGTHWAISLNGQTNLLSIGWNDYHASGLGGVLGTTNGSTSGNRTTLEEWRAAVPADSASVAQDPHFLDPSADPPDLKIDAAIETRLESGGLVLAGLDLDFEGEPRSGAPGYTGTGSAPDIGADEFEGIRPDLEPPAISFAPLGDSPVGATLSFTGVVVEDASGVSGEPGTRPRCYYKRSTDANDWIDNTPGTGGWKFVEASGAESPFDFTLDLSLLSGGGAASGDTIQYFVVAQDLAPVANVGIRSGSFAQAPESVALTSAAFPIGGGIDRLLLRDTIHGLFTVGPGGTYLTLAEAFGDLSAKLVDGEIDLRVLAPGTVETSPPVLDSLRYLGGPWWLTIGPAPGATATIRGEIPGGAILKLRGADRVVIDGSNAPGDSVRALGIENESPSGGAAAVWLASAGPGRGCRQVTVRNCVLRCGADPTLSSAETFGIFAGGDSLRIDAEGSGHGSLSIVNNEIRKVRWGVFATGSAGAPTDSLVVARNAVGPRAFGPEQIGRGGIVLRHQRQCAVRENVVRFVGGLESDPAEAADRIGIGLGASAWASDSSRVEGSEVTRNLVHDIVDEKGRSAAGIVLAGIPADGPSNNLVANNMVRDIRSNGSEGRQAVGLGIARGRGDRVVFNSVRLAGDLDPGASASAATSACGLRVLDLSVEDLSLENNILSVDLSSNDGALHHYAIVVPSAGYDWGAGGSDHNDYHADLANPQAVLGGLASTAPYQDVPTLADWRSLFAPSQDGSSIDSDPRFAAADDLHIDLGGPEPSPASEAGAGLIGVTIDYDGEARGVIPDIGADEFPSYRLSVSADGAGAVTVDPDLPKYNPGASVLLTAIADSAHVFTGWTGDHSGVENPLLLILDGDRSLTARFEPLGLAVTDAAVTEGDSGATEAVFLVSLAPVRADTVRVSYATADSSATESDGDYTGASGLLVFPPGVDRDSIRVVVRGDTIFEGHEILRLVLSGAIGASLHDSLGLGTIWNDDPVPSLRIGDLESVEGDSAEAPAEFVVTLSGPSAFEVRVAATTVEGAAAAGADFGSVADTLLFPPLVTEQTLLVPILGDSLDEFDESFEVRLDGAVGATLADSSATGTILDDDDPPQLAVNDLFLVEGNPPGSAVALFTVALSATSGKPVEVVCATADSSATEADGDYLGVGPDTLRFDPGETLLTRSVPVTVTGDWTEEPDEVFFLRLSSAVHAELADSIGRAVIANDDFGPYILIDDAFAAEGDTAAAEALFTVTLTAPGAGEVRVAAETREGSAAEGLDFAPVADTLVFPPFATERTLIVPILPDSLDEFDETFEVRLRPLSGAVLGDSTGTGTILDDDAPPSLSIDDVAVTEGNPPDTTIALFTVTLSAPSGKPVRAPFVSTDGTATLADGDYLPVGPDTLRFDPGDTLRTRRVAVAVLGDLTVEPDEEFRVILGQATHASFADSVGTGTILNDDSAGAVSSEAEHPAVTFLDRGEPNPFGDRVVLRWGLPQAGDVDLAVYDVRGRLVRRLVRGPETAGTKLTPWDGTDELGHPVTSGVYWIRLEADRGTLHETLHRIR